jgi:hypothetical protein
LIERGTPNGLVSVEGLDFGRGPVAEGLVQSGGVEPGDLFDDRELELRAGAPDAVADEFGLEGVDEALGQRVVVGAADRPYRAERLVVGAACAGAARKRTLERQRS